MNIEFNADNLIGHRDKIYTKLKPTRQRQMTHLVMFKTDDVFVRHTMPSMDQVVDFQLRRIDDRSNVDWFSRLSRESGTRDKPEGISSSISVQ